MKLRASFGGRARKKSINDGKERWVGCIKQEETADGSDEEIKMLKKSEGPFDGHAWRMHLSEFKMS